MVLYLPEAPYEGLAGLVAAGLGETTFVWQLDTLLAQPPPSHTILRRSHHRAAASLCVAFILLADLEVRLRRRGEDPRGLGVARSRGDA